MSATTVMSKDLYNGRYRVFSDGRLMNTETGAFIGREKETADGYKFIEVKMFVAKGGKRVYAPLKKVVYEAFVAPLAKRAFLLHRNGDYRDCSVDNIYIKGGVDDQVMEINRPKYPAPEFAFGPAPFTRYVAKRTGEVYNAMTGEEVEGKKTVQGTVVIRVCNDDHSKGHKMTAKTRFAYACFHHDFDMSDKTQQVYRRADSDINDNSVASFAVGTAGDMLSSARERDPTIATRAGQTLSRAVEVLEGGSVVAEHPSFRIACEKLDIVNPTLLRLIRSGGLRHGRTYRYQFLEVNVPEAWYKLLDTRLPSWATNSIKGVAGMYISDAGRVV